MSRPGGRRDDQLRKISITYEGLDRVDGSARFSFGQTSALASVSGPIEVRPAQENPAQATLDVQVRPVAALPGTDAKALATTLKGILAHSLFLARSPRTLVQIVGQALSGAETGSGSGSAGRGWPASLTAALVNAAAAALINAGSVPMKGVVCAVAVGRMTGGAVLVLDPEESELPRLAGGGCFAFLFSSTLGDGKESPAVDVPPCSMLWTNFTTSAPFDVDELSRARQLAAKGAVEVWLAMKGTMGSGAGTLNDSTSTQVKEENLSQNVPSGAMEVDDDEVEI
ncbi:3' exoribonuclease family, domain 1-domain-containing protein [Epithele typhae]|uniref:3' exoribonuclease family, domain 1-domain-containing protein n=1 Tax=Epithele typhae TaxID=378194 RepID=UPI002007F7EA|nr:3' exoribonuclease family, domain 1-domain-containing protein [Epithele typhae]KAH9916986.1 3' exoribonuclease family, domain 1-domain-containing protein [Epithele typhae]